MLVGSYLSQNSSHDFARSCFWQCWCNLQIYCHICSSNVLCRDNIVKIEADQFKELMRIRTSNQRTTMILEGHMSGLVVATQEDQQDGHRTLNIASTRLMWGQATLQWIGTAAGWLWWRQHSITDKPWTELVYNCCWTLQNVKEQWICAVNVTC